VGRADLSLIFPSFLGQRVQLRRSMASFQFAARFDQRAKLYVEH
jgi:hypothetical protein